MARELVAGLTTFVTMAYIIFANPAILAAAGVPAAAAQTATCLGAALATALMGLVARYPFALAPGMGLNAFLAYTLCRGLGYSWETGMAVVVLEGAAITILVLLGLRRWVMEALPPALKEAIGAGIGLFIAFIGLKEGGIVAAHPATLVTLGDLAAPAAVVCAAGLALTLALLARRVPGAILLGVAGATLLADAGFGLAPLPRGLAGVLAAPDFSTVGAFARGLRSALAPALLPVVFAFLVSDFFDTMGTVVAVGRQGGFAGRAGNLPRLGRVLFVDSLAALLGGVLGCSSVTTYVESSSGVAAGGRTGATALTVSALFLLAMWFGPLAAAVPACAVAPAMIVVGFLMLGSAARVKWHRLEDGFPAFLVLLLMPLTFSIATGIAWGVLGFLVVRTVQGAARKVHPLLWATGAALAVSLSPLAPR